MEHNNRLAKRFVLSCALCMHAPRLNVCAGTVPWPHFLAVSIPYSLVCLLLTWAALWMWYRPKLAEVDPVPHMELRPLTWKHAYVLGVCGVTVALWALNSLVIQFTGDNGIVALIPVVGLFALGLLKTSDIKVYIFQQRHSHIMACPRSQ